MHAWTLLLALPSYTGFRADHIPPDYVVRFARSFMTLFVFALPGLIAAVLAARRTERGLHRRLSFAFAITLAFVLLGSAVAATDALNEKRWNPLFYGGSFIGAALPASVAAASAREDSRRTSMIVLALMLALPLALLISGAAGALVWWAFEHGLPATW